MKRKRLDRDGWGFQGFPYYQMRVDLPDFHGMACVIRILSGDTHCWQMPRAGKVPVCGAGMLWLQLIPDDRHCVITVKYRPRRSWERIPRVALWYVDMIERTEADPDGVIAFIDQYLDVIFSPQGDVHTDDREELDAALASGELTPAQHARAVAEGERVIAEMCRDVQQTERWCGRVLQHVLTRLGDADVLRRNV